VAIRRVLLRWYDENRRNLPWRRDRDPYRVWVSEVMLQQTRVGTVAPYYERWLDLFPSVRALADAPDEEVLAAWAGLGYYRRARALHQAARVVRDRYAGQLPEGDEELRALPGVGAYTAGAIASIAFGRTAPAVDVNARRVLSRLFDLERPGPTTLERIATALVAPERPGEFNQALMELGATVCAPRSPACEACPLARWCLARARGTVAHRPARRPRARVPAYRIGTAVIVRRGRVLLARRPVEGLLGGMWEFPGALVARGESPARAAHRVASALGMEPPLRNPRLTLVDHAYSHRRHAYHAFRFDAADSRGVKSGDKGGGATVPRVHGAADWTELAWRPVAALDALPMGAAQRAIARALAERE
jgi:A/G-specific adenine glycosylase